VTAPYHLGWLHLTKIIHDTVDCPPLDGERLELARMLKARSYDELWRKYRMDVEKVDEAAEKLLNIYLGEKVA
jgi:hypothetical protein